KRSLPILLFGTALALAPAPFSTAEAKAKESAPAKAMKAPSLTATFVDKEAKAMKQTATVKVTVGGVKIIDPATVKEMPKAGEGHLHYQVDDGPVIATTATKLSFHGLKSGSHTIKVMLAANDHSELGPKESLQVDIK
ncbi:MAG TPA: hypothetical protein VGR00_02260, partial [Thermoanaerobaculia bacterium]|nr:hypothetical protein [Thermoanaerobaculia bacterium]